MARSITTAFHLRGMTDSGGNPNTEIATTKVDLMNDGSLEFTTNPTAASGTIQFLGNPDADDTITLNGQAWTFKASGATGPQTNVTKDTGTIQLALNPHPNDTVVLKGVTWTFVNSGATGTQTNITKDAGTIQFSANPTASDTFTLGGDTWTFVASGATGDQSNITRDYAEIVFAQTPTATDTFTMGGATWTFVASGATGDQTNITTDFGHIEFSATPTATDTITLGVATPATWTFVASGATGNQTNITKDAGTIVFSANPTATDTITLNGATWTFVAAGATGNQTNVLGTLALTLDQLVIDLQASADTAIDDATYTGDSVDTLTITHDTTGDQTGYLIDVSGLTAAPTSADANLLGGLGATITQLKTDLNASADGKITPATYTDDAAGRLTITHDTTGNQSTYGVVVAGLTDAPTSFTASLTSGKDLTVTQLFADMNSSATGGLTPATYSSPVAGTLRATHDTTGNQSAFTVTVVGLTDAPTSSDAAMTYGLAGSVTALSTALNLSVTTEIAKCTYTDDGVDTLTVTHDTAGSFALAAAGMTAAPTAIDALLTDGTDGLVATLAQWNTDLNASANSTIDDVTYTEDSVDTLTLTHDSPGDQTDFTISVAGLTTAATASANLSGGLAGTLAQLNTDLNASVLAALTPATYTQDGVDTLTITYDTTGAAGNAYALATSITAGATSGFPGTFLTGGSDGLKHRLRVGKTAPARLFSYILGLTGLVGIEG